MAIHTARFRPLSFRLVVPLPFASTKIGRTKLQGDGKRKPNQKATSYSFPFHSAHGDTTPMLALGVFLNQPLTQPPHSRGGEEVQDRLAASLVGEEVPDFEPILASLPVSLSALPPTGFSAGVSSAGST